jgi:hypothetical protein
MRTALKLLAMLSIGLVAMGADPFVGTWKLNLEKSELLANSNLASLTMTISPSGSNTFTSVIDSITNSGEKRHQEVIRIYDGKEHPAKGIGLNPGLSEISERVDASTRKVTGKRNGKILGTFTSQISPDGKTMTNRQLSSDGNEEVRVLERQ